MNIFEYDDYRDFLKEYLHRLPNNGYGKLAELSDATAMNRATLTLVLKKERDFTIDQAYEVCLFFGLTDFETEYFILSVQLQKAAKEKLKIYLREKLKSLRIQSHDLQNRLGTANEFDENAKAQYYSNWYFSAIRLCVSIEGLNNVNAIAKRLNLSLALVKQVCDFLIRHRLIENNDGHFKILVQNTHLPQNSPLVSRHHTNWRLKALSRIENVKNDEMFFTSPVVVAIKDMPAIREILTQCLAEVFKVADPSKEEEIACLNIDWFRI